MVASNLLAVALPHAHQGPVAGLGWSFDPLVWAGVALTAVLYARGLRRWHPRSHPYSAWHPIAFYSALIVALGALQSPLEHLAGELFVAHMLEHMLLTMVVAPLLVLGAPVTPLLRGLPVTLRLRLVRPLAKSRLARRLFPLLVRPLVAWALATAALWAWHLPAAYDLALSNQAVHLAQHLCFLLTAVLFWAAVMDISPLRSHLSYPMRLFYLLAGAAQNAALALFIIVAVPGLYPFYLGQTRPSGLSVAGDQVAGGILMLFHGTMTFVAAMVVCLFIWLEKEEQRAQMEEDQVAPQVGT